MPRTHLNYKVGDGVEHHELRRSALIKIFLILLNCGPPWWILQDQFCVVQW